MDDLRDEVHNDFAGRAHWHSCPNVLFGERGERHRDGITIVVDGVCFKSFDATRLDVDGGVRQWPDRLGLFAGVGGGCRYRVDEGFHFGGLHCLEDRGIVGVRVEVSRRCLETRALPLGWADKSLAFD